MSGTAGNYPPRVSPPSTEVERHHRFRVTIDWIAAAGAMQMIPGRQLLRLGVIKCPAVGINASSPNYVFVTPS